MDAVHTPDTMSVAEVAEYLRVHRNKVVQLIHSGRLVAVDNNEDGKVPRWRSATVELHRYMQSGNAQQRAAKRK